MYVILFKQLRHPYLTPTAAGKQTFQQNQFLYTTFTMFEIRLFLVSLATIVKATADINTSDHVVKGKIMVHIS